MNVSLTEGEITELRLFSIQSESKKIWYLIHTSHVSDEEIP